MNFKTTAILFIVLLAMGGILLFLNRDQGQPAQTKREAKLIDVSTADVTGLTVTPADGQKFILARTGHDWRLVEPVSAAAETWSVDALVRRLADLTSRGESPTSLADAGLDQPAFIVEIATGQRTHKINIGRRMVAGGTLFIQREGDRRPIIVGDDLYEQLEKPYAAYRQTKLVAASSGDIRQISIQPEEGEKLTLARGDEGWRITQPQEMPAETSEVTNLVFALTGLNATEFVKEADVPAVLHPAKNARMTIWFSTSAPSTQPADPEVPTPGVTVHIGDYDSLLKQNVYVSVAEPATLAKVPASSIEAFNRTSLDLRDRKVVEIDPALVSAVSIRTSIPAATEPAERAASSSELTIERRKEEVVLGPALPEAPATQPAQQASDAPVSPWLLKAPTAGEASPARVDDLLERFNPLRADKYLASGKVEQPAAVYTIAIITASAGRTTEHRLSFTDPGDDDPLVGEYNGLFFEVSRTLVDAITGDFVNR
jgi:hypothetical protein